MRLISKFHDYYDTALAHGQDDTVLYLRERGLAPALLSEALLPWEAKSTRGWRRGSPVGERVGLVLDERVHKPERDWKPGVVPRGRQPHEGSHCWHIGEAFVVLAGKAHSVWVRRGMGQALLEGAGPVGVLGGAAQEHLVEAMEATLGERMRPDQMRVQVRMADIDDEDARHYAAARARMLDHDFTDLHLETEAPVLLAAPINLLYPNKGSEPESIRKALATGGAGANTALILNPRLADLGFQRAVDPYTCFQAISQFIEGVIPGQQLPMATISDASQVRKKGFDPVYGFRKRPASHG